MNDYEARLIRVLDHIHANPDGDLSLDVLADVAALSRFHFHRVFRAITGATIAETVRHIRMDHAAAMLTHGDRPITEIAGKVGYRNVSSFTRAFAEVHDMPPGTYRRAGTYRTKLTTFRTGDPAMTHPVTIQTADPRRFAGLPHRGPYPEVGRALDRLVALLAARGLMERAEGVACVFLDDPETVAPEDLTSLAGVFVSPDFPVEPPLEAREIAGGRYAVMRYTGPYAGLSAAYDAFLCTWLPGSGEEPGEAPLFETYINSPEDTPPDKLITEIWLLLKG